MTKMHCQGRCGELYPIEELEMVGPAAQRMCPGCAEDAQGETHA